MVFDSKRRFLAIGLYDPESPIRIKILHHGAPATIDDAFWAARISAAVRRRAPLEADPGTNGFRLVNGENDGLGGLIVDRYDTTVVVKVYSSAWFPHLDPILAAIDDEVAPDRIVMRLSRLVQRSANATVDDGDTVFGPAPTASIPFLEHGLTFTADVVGGQKTGHFLDQRDNRATVRRLAGDTDVLDVFSCTGGFAVHAAAGGARSVHRIDISPSAIALGDANIAANPSSCRHESTTADAFDALAELASSGRSFDIVVVDPPSFAKRQTEVDGALAAYSRLTNAGLRVLRPGGLLVQASCSSRVTPQAFEQAVSEAAQRSGRPLDVVQRTGHALDHPATFPEGHYLKALYARA